MTEILTSAQMRAIERAAIESGSVTGLDLMERAGRGVVEAILAEWPELAQGAPRAVVLCGPGNNGGDGFVVARLLAGRGWTVRVLAAVAPGAMPPDAAENALRWCASAPVEPLTEEALRSGPPNDLYIDAIFGTGLSRAPLGDIAEVLTHIGGRNGDAGYYSPRLVAVDAPSVLCLDSGRSLYPGWDTPRARLSVTFDSPKVGHLLAQGPALCGKVAVMDIGIAPWRRLDNPREVQGHWSGTVRPVRLGAVGLVGAEEMSARHQPGAIVPARFGKAGWSGADYTHKFTFGHALVLSGGPGNSGAARLAARGALRIGAGLVTVGCPPEAVPENAARLDAIMLREVADDAAYAGLLEDRRINAVCIGPALGLGTRAARLVGAVLDMARHAPPSPPLPHEGGGSHPDCDGDESESASRYAALPLAHVGAGALPRQEWSRDIAIRRHLVLDADALTILARNPELFAALHGGCVLTPHAGEFARLFPDIAAQLTAPAEKGPAFSKVDATRAAAARAGCVILFKGADTVIADPSGRASIHSAAYDRAAPWLATAGAGDVLAGFIAGLMARGLAPFDAACTAAWLHVEAARAFGPGLIAEDLPEQLPGVFRKLGI